MTTEDTEMEISLNERNKMIDECGEVLENTKTNGNEAARRDKFIKRLQVKRREYIEMSTIHGVPKIVNNSRLESCFWACVVFIGVAYSSYGIVTLVSKYFRYSIYTSVSLHVTPKNLFPSITFCDKDMMTKNYYTYCGVEDGGTHDSPNIPCPYELTTIKRIDSNLDAVNQWSNGMFHVTGCVTWGNKNCANSIYLTSLSKHNHSCFRWNWLNNLYDAYGHADITFKLNHTSKVNFSQMFAIIHDPNISELEMMNHLILEPNKSNQLKISKTEMKRLPSPFPSNCMEAEYGHIFPGKYTHSTCLDYANNIEMFKKCGDTFDYIKRIIKQEDPYLFEKYHQNRSISKVLECLKSSFNWEFNSTLNCPVPCNEVEFAVIPSTFDSVKANETIFTIAIQYERFDSFKLIEEKQLYTWDQIAGGVGGFLGLIIGVSLVSIVELIVYCILSIIEKCTRHGYL